MIIYIGNYLTDHKLNPNFNQFLSKKFEEMGYEVIRASNKKYWIPRLLDMLSTIYKYRKKTEYIYIDTFSSLAFWFAYFCGKLAYHYNIPYFTIVRGGDMETRLNDSPKKTQWLFNHSKQNISPSLYLEHILKQENLPVIYIPNFLDIATYPFKVRKTFSPKILWVRSLHQVYQPLLACKIIDHLRFNYPDIQMTMVGPDKDQSKEDIEKYISRHKLENHIKLTGKLSKEEWHQLSESHDIFLNTTSVDNHPVSVIEAMALGLPIVSTDAGGLIYLLKDGEDALLTNHHNFEKLCRNIEYIIHNPEDAMRLAANARKKVELFDWSYIEKSYRELMQH